MKSSSSCKETAYVVEAAAGGGGDNVTAHDEFQAALAEYRAAQRLFDAAEPDRVDEAVYRLRAAELRVSAALRQLKEAQHHVAS